MHNKWRAHRSIPACVAIFFVNGRKNSFERVSLFLCFLFRFNKLNSRPASFAAWCNNVAAKKMKRTKNLFHLGFTNSFEVLSHLRRTGDEFCVTTFCATIGCWVCRTKQKLLIRSLRHRNVFHAPIRRSAEWICSSWSHLILLNGYYQGSIPRPPPPRCTFFNFDFLRLDIYSLRLMKNWCT